MYAVPYDEMAAEPNTGFHQQAFSFQSGAIGDSSSDMIMMGDYYSHPGMNLNVNNRGIGGGGGGGGIMFSGNPSMITNNNDSSSSPGISPSGSSSASFFQDTAPGLKHDTGLAVEWTVEEQYKLEEGLIKFANEPCIMKYIKIAATLRDKTVRDVSLRCRWITRKRRKQEDYRYGKKLRDRKDKSAEMSSKTNASSASPMSLALYSLSMNRHSHGNVMPSAAALHGTKRLLEENYQALHQISANLSTFKLQENVDLFLWTRNNITAVLNEMRNMPGIMSQMPPLPVFLNEELASSVLPISNQYMMFVRRSGIQLKQEPGCL